MRGVLVFGFLALAIWAAVEVQTHGVEGAFGGVLAPFDAPEHRSTAKRAGEAVQRAHDASQERLDRQLEQLD